MNREIPKIIHYCWFGGKPLPEKYQKYIESWKTYLPEYEIKEWNESNFNVDICQYTKEAYEAKKWAFVSDYARFKILYEYGGLYFDTDVEIIGSLEHIIEKGSFLAIEKIGGSSVNTGMQQIGVAAGLGMGAVPGLKVYKEILELYENSSFINSDGKYKLDTVVFYTSSVLKKYGFVESDVFQRVAEVNIYPSSFFDPMDCETGELNISENTITIHHYACSWANGKIKWKKKLQKILGSKITILIIKLKRKLDGK